jgi:hypothetical protein
MKKIAHGLHKHYKLIVLLLLIAGAFYWFEFRPSTIKTACESDTHSLDTKSKASGDLVTMTQLNFHYSACLHQHGI